MSTLKVGRGAFPPNYKARPIQVRKFRYVADAAVDSSVYRESLLSLIAVYGDSTTTTISAAPIQAIRLRRVQIWSVAASVSAFGNISLKFQSSLGPAREYVASGNQVMPAHLSVAPPEGSLAGMWSVAASQESVLLFHVKAPSGAIIDIECEYVLSESNCSILTGTTHITGVYYPHLDCLNGSNGAGDQKLSPVELVTTALTNRSAVSPA